MAPNTTGHAATDHLRIMALAEMALDFALEILAPGGGFVAKVFQGGSERQMLDAMKRHFATVRHAKPPASRKEFERALRGRHRLSRVPAWTGPAACRSAPCLRRPSTRPMWSRQGREPRRAGIPPR